MIVRTLKRKALLGLGLVATTLPVVAAVSCEKLTIGAKNNPYNDANYASVAKHLRAQGSSSVLPIMTGLKDALSDFQYEGTGSGDGLKVATGEISEKDFGATSSLKHPTSEQVTKWTNNKNKTLTFAIDAIGIALHLPNSLSALNNTNNRPIVDASELAKLYNNDSNDDAVTWGDLLENPEADNNNNLVKPLGRTGGKASSGTADGFFNGLEKATGLTEAQLDVNHNTLPNSQQTAEANAAALMALSDQNNINSLTYLSLGYALSNESSNIVVATIKTSSGSEWVPSLENVKQKTYNWTRPFNIIYSLKNHDAISFAKMILSNQVQYAIEQIGFVSTNEIKQQLLTNFDKSDAELHADITKDPLGVNV